MYYNRTTLCSLCEGKEGEKTIYISLVFMNCRNSNQNAADYLFGLIAKLTLVSEGCDVGTQKVKNFDWYKVGISVLTRSMKQELKLLLGSFISFVVRLTNS